MTHPLITVEVGQQESATSHNMSHGVQCDITVTLTNPADRPTAHHGGLDSSPPCAQHREGTAASEACNQAEKRRGEAALGSLLWERQKPPVWQPGSALGCRRNRLHPSY